MIARPSLEGRVALAVALLIGFYVLALALAGGLLYIPYAEWVYAHRVTGRILVFCGVGALAILNGIIPRPDRFEPPGPAVTESAQPRLFAVINEVASATEQAMPQEVYLTADVNAFVAQRGGVMGFGSRRVMGIGLPLLEALNVGQLRAVVAHEFGHYHGGDTKLGPWIYKTRASIIRTLQSLENHSGLLQKPFIWYGAAFSRLTLAISRRQEYVADEIAARTCGAGIVAQALTALERSGNAFAAFIQTEYAGVIQRGFRPPFIEGFARFQSAPRVSAMLDELFAKGIEGADAGPYDSHPSLKQRLAALSELPGDAPSRSNTDESRAIALIDDLPGTEAAVLSQLRAGGAAPLPIDWDDVPSRVLSVDWARTVQPALPGLDGLTPSSFCEIAERLRGDADVLARQLGVHGKRDPEGSRSDARGILGASLCLVLNEHRQRSPETIQLSAAPGEPVEFRIARDDGETLIEPFAVLQALESRTLQENDWLAMCRVAGIADNDLGSYCRRANESHPKAASDAVLG